MLPSAVGCTRLLAPHVLRVNGSYQSSHCTLIWHVFCPYVDLVEPDTHSLYLAGRGWRFDGTPSLVFACLLKNCTFFVVLLGVLCSFCLGNVYLRFFMSFLGGWSSWEAEALFNSAGQHVYFWRSQSRFFTDSSAEGINQNTVGIGILPPSSMPSPTGS